MLLESKGYSDGLDGQIFLTVSKMAFHLVLKFP